MYPSQKWPEEPPLFLAEPFTPWDELKLLASLAGVSIEHLCATVESAAKTAGTPPPLTPEDAHWHDLDEVARFLENNHFDITTKSDWNEALHPRDDEGRFTGGHSHTSIARMTGESSDAHPAHYEDIELDPLRQQAFDHLAQHESDDFFRLPLKHVLKNMPDDAVHTVLDNVQKTEFFETSAQLVDSMPGLRSDNEGTLGYYNLRTQKLVLDGDGDGKGFERHCIYAHEIGHVLDGPEQMYSTDPVWIARWGAEIKNGSLGAQAMKNAAEGFAEFANVCYSGEIPHSMLQETYKSSFNYWKANGLV